MLIKFLPSIDTDIIQPVNTPFLQCQANCSGDSEDDLLWLELSL